MQILSYRGNSFRILECILCFTCKQNIGGLQLHVLQFIISLQSIDVVLPSCEPLPSNDNALVWCHRISYACMLCNRIRIRLGKGVIELAMQVQQYTVQ